MRSRRSEPDVLVLLDLLSRLRALQSFPWRCLQSMESRRGLAAVATLLGAGMMGAMMFVRGISRRVGSAGAQQGEYTVPGLVNWGNNCFLNAVLQALASSEKFLSYLTISWSAEKLQSLPLSAELSKLLQELSEVRSGPRTVSPRSVMLVLGHYVKNFDLAAQQDAAEALSHLATALQQERMEDFELQRPAWQSLANASAPPDAAVESLLDWWRQQLRWPTEGTFGSLLVCSKCDFKASMQFQIFRDLPLCPPRTANGSIAAGCSLEDCLVDFTTVERVHNVKCNRCAHMAAIRYLSLKSENNKDLITTIRNCNSDDICSCEFLALQQGGIWCDTRREAEKCLRIGRCPEVLCVHLQRVIVNGVGQLEKLKGHISFPVELNLYPFTIAAKKNDGSVPSAKVDLLAGRALDSEYFMMSLRSRCVGGNATAMDCDSQQIPPSQAVEEEERIHSEAEMQIDAMEHEVYKVGHEADLETTPTNKIADTKSGVAEPDKRSKLYNLFSVVVHYGGATGGHYTVYRKVKVPRQQLSVEKQHQPDGDGMAVDEELEAAWFQISDADVTRVSQAEVLSAEASLLFYEQSE